MTKIKNIASVIIVIMLLGGIIYKIGKRHLTMYMLKRDAQYVRAVIIDEKNQTGNSPVSHDFTYSYLFYVEGKSYTGNSFDAKLQVGDSIDIAYVKTWPELNRPITFLK
nr:hypothetical protein [uncultured Chitinophaga sp.]